MDHADVLARFSRVEPVHLDRQVFVRAYNTDVKTKFGRRHFFDSEWSYARGYRYNFKGTQPVLIWPPTHLQPLSRSAQERETP